MNIKTINKGSSHSDIAELLGGEGASLENESAFKDLGSKFNEHKTFKNATSERKKNSVVLAQSGAGHSAPIGKNSAYRGWMSHLYGKCESYPRGKYFDFLRNMSKR